MWYIIWYFINENKLKINERQNNILDRTDKTIETK